MAKAKPKLGALVDRLWLLRQSIRKAEAEVKKEKGVYKKLVDKIMEDYEKAEVAKAAGKLGQASISPRAIYRVSDQHKFLTAVRKRKAWHLLKAQLNTDEFNTMMEEKGETGAPVKGKKPAPLFPGVSLFTDVRLHLTSVKRGKGRVADDDGDLDD